MKVAFHLRRKPSAEPASAVLLEADRVEPLLALAERLGPRRPIAVYRVQGGFLIVLEPGTEPPPGPTRLRSVSANLFVPVDAELVPALLDDEARGIVRDRGLIFLPGGRVLGFEPDRPLSLASLVTTRRVEGTGWRPFPDRPGRAERVTEIFLEASEDAGGLDPFDRADALGPAEEPGVEPLDESEAARPAVDPDIEPASLAGKAALGAGKGLMGLGDLLGIRALTNLGTRWIERSLGKGADAPPGEAIGRQEGALRELLRQFREGEVERALRHALPLVGDAGRGGVSSGDGKLPEVDPTYSLQSLLGSVRGPSGLWFGSVDLQAELAREYRRAAEEAERRGDDRRAAYIHGRLLHDFATAAQLLTRAGLHRDAAFVYLNRLKDVVAAARSFEAAGEADRALGLYRQHGRFAEAGDLLRRVGDEDAALVEYGRAADALAGDPRHGAISAGDLLRDRARCPDLALTRYAAGWARRPSSDAVACALRMASILGDAGQAGPLVELVGQADALLKRPGSEAQAVEFYNVLVRLADRSGLAEVRDDLRDRALIGLAAKLREQVATTRRPGTLASGYFGRNSAWPADLVVDAIQATRTAVEREADRRSVSKMVLGPMAGGSTRRIAVGGGTVSAACHAPSTGMVFLGFEGGRIGSFHPPSGVVDGLAEEGTTVASLAVDPDGRTLVALLGEGPGPRRLLHLERGRLDADWARQYRTIDGPGDFWLTPVIGDGRTRGVGIWNGEEMVLMGGLGELMPWTRLPMSFLKTDPAAALLVPALDGKPPAIRAVLVHDGPDICQVESMGKMVRRRHLGWRPTLAEGHTLRSAPLAWVQVEPGRFELAGLDREGMIHWSSLRVNDAELIRDAFNDSRGNATYQAATIARPGLVAGVARGRVDWLRCGSQTFADVGSTPLEADSALACFPAPTIDELVVVCRDGTLVCVPCPR